jgi:hypothetical protein
LDVIYLIYFGCRGPLGQEESYVWACSTHKGEVMPNNFMAELKAQRKLGKAKYRWRIILE